MKPKRLTQSQPTRRREIEWVAMWNALQATNLENVISPNLRAKKDTHPVHRFFAYPAKFQSQLPTSLIEHLTRPGDLVCDPFSGGGTTAAAALLLGRRAYGIDLNPIAVLVSTAKTRRFTRAQFNKAVSQLRDLRPAKKRERLSEEEWILIGSSLGSAVEAIWEHVASKRDKVAPVIATALIKRIKLACRRDKNHLRTASFEQHIEYIVGEITDFFAAVEDHGSEVAAEIEMGSNHTLPLKKGSVDLIVTSPPYPGVDVEYNLIQLQRRDLNRCFRSDVGVRIASEVIGRKSDVKKKDLCDGGIAGNYWDNLRQSLAEMYRVLKTDAFAFLYIGFKSQLDKARFEKLLCQVGFSIFGSFKVELGKERVASSRGLYHGKDTAMMQDDVLYVLRKA